MSLEEYYKVSSSDMVDVADAIRTKGGTQAALTWPAGWKSAVQAIPSGGGGARLPSEYQEVEYLESTGTQYINTGVLSSSDLETIIKGVLCGEVSGSLQSDVLCGVRSNSAGTVARYQVYSRIPGGTFTSYRGTYGNNQVTVNNVLGANTIDFRYNSAGDVLFERTVLSLSGDFTPSNNYICLFACGDDNNSPSYFAKGRIYACKMKNRTTNTVLRNYVPCYRKSDNEPGMYDLINNVFKPNEGTGSSFVIGIDVNYE